jgi:hypothetical protein
VADTTAVITTYASSCTAPAFAVSSVVSSVSSVAIETSPPAARVVESRHESDFSYRDRSLGSGWVNVDRLQAFHVFLDELAKVGNGGKVLVVGHGGNVRKRGGGGDCSKNDVELRVLAELAVGDFSPVELLNALVGGEEELLNVVVLLVLGVLKLTAEKGLLLA